MSSIFVTRVDIARSPEIVWPYLVNWERLGQWMGEARDFRVVSAHRAGVGVEAEATVRIVGITTRDLIRVSHWEPPVILEMEHFGWVRGTGYMELSPTEEGTHLFWREELVPPWGLLGAVGMWLASPAIRRTFRRDADALRNLIEELSE
ncbi:MAG: SRPBCC family protein [Actinomycetota bacterium]